MFVKGRQLVIHNWPDVWAIAGLCGVEHEDVVSMVAEEVAEALFSGEVKEWTELSELMEELFDTEFHVDFEQSGCDAVIV